MAIRKLKNGGRKKAFLGLSSAGAIMAAAGINAATQLTAAGMNAAAARESAKQQAQATTNSARQQAQAIKDQSAKANEMQTQSQEFMREQNEQNREIQKDTQMYLQMLAGQQGVNDRLEASRIVVRNGGKTRRRLREAGTSTSSLQGSNMPFVVTDGGGVVFVGKTPEGYDLYEVKGNDHDHYHKAQAGKNKTGVGIKFADGTVIEGEGNQNGMQGEYMLNTPDNAYFISKHNVAGINPAKMVNGGMHPLQAFAIQETLKEANGISDDDKNSSPVRKAMIGLAIDPLIVDNQIQPYYTNENVATGVAYDTNRRLLRCGGKSRRKAAEGLIVGRPKGATHFSTSPNTNYKILKYPSVSNNNKNNAYRVVGNGSWFTRNADLIGAGITGLGNVGGALITTLGNRSASRTMQNAYGESSRILADAYSSLTGIDPNALKREDFAAAHAMPAIQTYISDRDAPLALAERSLHRRLDNAGRYSASSAAAQGRMNDAEVAAQDVRNQIFAADAQKRQAVQTANLDAINKAAMLNAQLDTEANSKYAENYLDALEYNNDINNQRILGSAGALSEGILSSANARASARMANAQAWANAGLNTAKSFANSFENIAARKAGIENILFGSSDNSAAMYYATNSRVSKTEALNYYNALKARYNAALNSNATPSVINTLRQQINAIANNRGFEIV